jgi:hypothetical protein
LRPSGMHAAVAMSSLKGYLHETSKFGHATRI